MDENTPDTQIGTLADRAHARKRESKRRQGQRLSAEQVRDAQAKFLRVFRNNGVFRAAAHEAGVSREAVRLWLNKDAKFKKAFEDAEEDANDLFRGEIIRRATRGVEKPAISGGRLVYEYEPVLNPDGSQRLDKNGRPLFKRGQLVKITEYSDQLLMFHAKARMPEYREHQEIDHHGITQLPPVNFTLTTQAPPEPEEPPDPTFEETER